MSCSKGLYGVLRELAERHPDTPATIDLSFGLRSNHAELLARVDGLASAWFERGVVPGSRVLWLGQNSARVLEGLLACARLGAIFCPVNWRQSEAELSFVIEDVDPVLVIWQQQEIGTRLDPLRAKYAGLAQIWIRHDGESSDYETSLSLASGVVAEHSVDENEAVLMLYTAAFAGQPNGALLSHRAIMAQSDNFAEVRGLTAEARYLNVGPLFHVATLLETMATFQAGGCNVFIRRAEAGVICEAVEKEQCNSAFLLPPVIDNIIAYGKEKSVNLKNLRALAGSAEWNALVTVDDSLWGKNPFGFGQTETFGYATYCALAGDCVGSMGTAAPGVEVCMLDDVGRVLPAGEVGEIAVRGATVMNAYWQRPELNTLRRTDGWHRSNDLGQMEPDGSLSFVGPKQKMIRSGQENIYPAEVENCLLCHSAVQAVAVIGVPDPQWDQSVKAIVVLAEGVQCTPADLIDFCRERIASYKKPKSVEFVETLPKVGGVTDYQALDRNFGGGGYPGTD